MVAHSAPGLLQTPVRSQSAHGVLWQAPSKQLFPGRVEGPELSRLEVGAARKDAERISQKKLLEREVRHKATRK